MSRDCADLMIDLARQARELRELRAIIRELTEDLEGLRLDLGRPKPTFAEQKALAQMRSEENGGASR